MVEVLPLEKAADGYQRMLANQARFRVVLTTEESAADHHPPAPVTDGMIVEWDAPNDMDDDLQLPADIFRPRRAAVTVGASATTSPRRPFTPPRSHRSHADGDSPIPQALPACSKTPTACRHASGDTKPTLGDPSPPASSSISSAHRLHNTGQGPHGRLIRAPETFASS